MTLAGVAPTSPANRGTYFGGNMAQLPRQTIVQQIDAVTTEQYPRPHLGASVIGHPCIRYLVYSFHWAHKSKIDGKSWRIFRMGDDVETRIVEALQSIGIEVFDTQVKVTDSTGHGGGSIDGKLKNVPRFEDDILLFEAKSMNHTNYLDVVKKGVKESKPVYFAQMQMYMGRLKLDAGLFVALNKNTSDLYTEAVLFDQDAYADLVAREQEVITAGNINEYPRLSTNPSWYQCKFCDAKNVCHHGEKVAENCRTCVHITKHDQGQWYCEMQGHYRTDKGQAEGCERYELDTNRWS